MNNDRLLNAADVAERLNTSVRSAQRLMLYMRHINIGLGTKNKCLRVSEASLNEYKAQQEDAGLQPPDKQFNRSSRKGTNRITEVKRMPRR